MVLFVQCSPVDHGTCGNGNNNNNSSLLGSSQLWVELLSKFDDDLRPRLRPVPVKCRQFLSSCSLNGKVLYESHTSELLLQNQNQMIKQKNRCQDRNGGSFNGRCGRPGYKAYFHLQSQSDGVNGNHCRIDEEECWDFHLKEHEPTAVEEAPAFAGCRNLVAPSAAIRSKSGTVRGVTNRVRQGIATFLHNQCQKMAQQETGRVVVYVSTLGIIRETHKHCAAVTSILRTLLVHFDERDVFLSRAFQTQLVERLGLGHVHVPHVFVEGQHLGDAETIERLNETGQLRQILRPYKRVQAMTSCSKCGGYRLLPCTACNGSKKSGHRNTFTEEFMALRCMQCDESGLIRCDACA